MLHLPAVDVCSTCFLRCSVYPGHGIRFVTRTGQLVVLSTSKVTSLYHQRKKPAKLYWTLASRRAHKKLNTEAGIKKRARRVVKVQRVYGDKEKMAEVCIQFSFRAFGNTPGMLFLSGVVLDSFPPSVSLCCADQGKGCPPRRRCCSCCPQDQERQADPGRRC